MKTKRILTTILTAILCTLSLIAMGIPVLADTIPPIVTTQDPTAITTNSAVLNGNLSSLGSASEATVFFEYGTTTRYGNSTSAIATSNTGAFSVQLNGISPGVTYHYRAKVDAGTAGVAVGMDDSFTTLTVAPIVRTLLPLNIIANGVVLNGSLDSLGTAASVTVYFDYGTTTAYSSTTSGQTMTAAGNYSFNVTNLTPDTYYHFRARVNGGVQGSDEGEDAIFKTPSASPPQVNTNPAISITETTATLVGNITTPGSAGTVTVSFEYGTTIEYGLKTSTKSFSGAGYTGGFTIDITSTTPLTRGTTYHFRAKADGGANGISYGDDMTFTTPGLAPPTPPTVDTSAASDIATSTVTLCGNLMLTGTASTIVVYFEYGKTTSYGFSTPAQSLTDKGIFTAPIENLSPGVLYHFRAKADGGPTLVAIGPDMTFTTASIAPSVNTVEASEITSSTAVLNGFLASTGTAGSVKVSFEYGATDGYGVTTSSKTLTTSGDFSISLTSLKVGTTYHFRSKADGGVNGLSNGVDMTFATLKPASINVADSSITVMPANAGINEKINITVPVKNSGESSGTNTFVLKINGLIEQTQDITLPAGGTQNISFIVSRDSPGNYQVDINGAAGSFTISQNPTTSSSTQPISTTPVPKQGASLPILAIGAGAAVVIGLLVYMLMRRRA